MRKYSLFLLSLLCLNIFAQKHSVINESVVTVNTYAYSDPDPVAEPQAKIYPYFLFDGYSHTSTPKEWKKVTLENDYISVSLFPEIGGKIWGAYDKVNQKEFVYTNDAVKFRNIAMRGPWTSGGIEFNFGIIGHEPTTSSPVDYLTRENHDGSVSCFIASFDWVTGNYWSVEVNLHPDKAYFTTKSTVFNHTSIDAPYYHWMNGAFSAQNDPEFVYPGNTYIGHDGDAHPFPADEYGNEISWYEKNNFGGSKSYHVLGYYNDFYGIYWHGIDYGSFHLSSYDEKLGMKIFLWSLARDGGIWEDLLTDHKGQYIEMQSGKKWNQPVYNSGLTPFKNESIKGQATDTWLEYWFPAQGTQGVKKTSPAGSLNVIRMDNTIKLLFSPLEKRNTFLRLYNGTSLLKELPMNLEILRTWESVVPLSIPEGKLRIEIGDKLLEYSEAKEDNELSRPKELPSDFDWNSTYGLYVRGEQALNSHMPVQAEKYLTECVAKDRYFVPALIRLSSLYIQQAKYDKAFEMLKTVLAMDAYDEEGNYLYGLCCRALNNLTDAKDGFSIASNSLKFRSASLEQLSEIYLLQNDLKKAEHYALKSLDFNSMNLKSRQMLSVVYRIQGMTDAAINAIRPMLEQVPLYPAGRYEAYRNGIQTKDDFVSLERCEMPQETFMELAGFYEGIGKYDDALEILSMADSPLALIRSAYILKKMGGNSSELISKAVSASPEYVFSFRSEDIDALRYAMTQTDDWKIRYYLAQVLIYKNQKEEAMSLLDGCTDTGYAPFYLFVAHQSEGQKRLDALKKAESLEMSWRTGRDLIRYYQQEGDIKSALSTAVRYHRLYPDNYLIALSTATCYEKTGNFKEAGKILSKTSILPYENSREGYVAFYNTNMGEAVRLYKQKNYKSALKYVDECMRYPENLGVGKPFDEEIDTRLVDYMKYLIYTGMKRKNDARAYLDKVCAASGRVGRNFRSLDLITCLSLRDNGKVSEADEIASSWRNSSDAAARWSYAIYSGDMTSADSTASEFRTMDGCDVPAEMIYHDNYSNSVYRLFGK